MSNCYNGYMVNNNNMLQASDTKAGNFYVTRDEIRIVKYMNQKGGFNYYTSEELQVH